MSDAESPENTGQTPPNQRNHPDSSPHPQDAPSCRTCAPVTANAARVLGMSRLQPTGGYVKYHQHEPTQQPYSQPATTTGPQILSPKRTRSRPDSGRPSFTHQTADRQAHSNSHVLAIP